MKKHMRNSGKQELKGIAIARFLLLTCCLPAFLITHSASGQILKGKWVDEADARIEKLRKVPLRAIVMDKAGKPVAAEVQIKMTRHAFPFGVTFDPVRLGAIDLKNEVWRGVSAVSFDSMTAWPAIESKTPQKAFNQIDRMVDLFRLSDLQVGWGGVVSADVGRWPQTVTALKGEPLRNALDHHIKTIAGRYGARVGQFDIYTDVLDNDAVGDRLGTAMVRRMFTQTKTIAPHATLCVRFRDCLRGTRMQLMARRVAAMRQSFIPLDAVCLEMQLAGQVSNAALTRSLSWIDHLGVPVIITSLEVGGPSPAAAAMNLEAVLLTLYSNPNIAGIWFKAFNADAVDDPNAALIDGDGQATKPGQLFDRLVYSQWRTDETVTADALGNLRATVYAGHYDLTAKLPDGTSSSAHVLLDKPQPDRIIILQPLAISASTKPE